MRVWLGRTLSAGVVACMASTSQAGSAMAANPNTWQFQGLAQAPSGVLAGTLNGWLTAPTASTAGGFRLAGRGTYAVDALCLVRDGDPIPTISDAVNYTRPCRRWAFPSQPDGYYGIAPGSTAPIEITMTAWAGPGTYRVYLASTASDEVELLEGVPPLNVTSVSESRPWIAGPTRKPVRGEPFELRAQWLKTFSDGSSVVSDVGADDSVELQVRRLGSRRWQCLTTTPTYTGKLTVAFQARYLVNGTPSKALTFRVPKNSDVTIWSGNESNSRAVGCDR